MMLDAAGGLTLEENPASSDLELGDSDGDVPMPDYFLGVRRLLLLAAPTHGRAPPTELPLQAELGGGGWPVHTGFHGAGGGSGSGDGDVKVCGESQWGLGPDHSKQCYGGLNSNAHDVATQGQQESHGWEHANEVCTEAGARLCTVTELMNEVTRGTGCQHDAEMTWSSETHASCDGHITVQGGQHRGDEACPDECHVGWISGGNGNGQNCATCKCTPRCAPDSVAHAVRCCADVDVEEAKVRCEKYIGYRGTLKPPPPVTNMQSTSGAGAGSIATAADVQTQRQCKSETSCAQLQKSYGGWQVGARTEDVRAGACTGGQYPISGNPLNPLDSFEHHEKMVCAESAAGLGSINAAGQRTNQCHGGTNGGQDGGCHDTVGDRTSHSGAAGSGGADNRISGWSHALSICEGVGARLCTIEELLADVTRNRGCGHDCEMVWSSQTWSGCKPNQHLVAQGGSNCGYQICPTECPCDQYTGERSCCMCKPRCADDSESRAVRCCADVFFEGSNMRDVELTADLPTGSCHFDPCVNVACAQGQTPENSVDCDAALQSCLIHTPHVHGGNTCPESAVSGQHSAVANQLTQLDQIMARSDHGAACNNGVRRCGATSESTMGWNGEPDRAIDGRHCSEFGEGSCTHTDAGVVDDREANGRQHGPAWWQVDLGGPTTVTKVDVWHRTGCGDTVIDPVTGHQDASACNRRLEGAHVFVSNEERAPGGTMWSVTTCNRPCMSATDIGCCTICGVIHDALGQQPEHVVCGLEPQCNSRTKPDGTPNTPTCGPRGMGCRKGTYTNGQCPNLCADGNLADAVTGMCASSCPAGTTKQIVAGYEQCVYPGQSYGTAPTGGGVANVRQDAEAGLGAQNPQQPYSPLTNPIQKPHGRYVSVSHVHDGPTDHSQGGSSDGWVITLCEVRVTGAREAENYGAYVSPTSGSCLEYQPGGPNNHPEPIQPPPPPAACASAKSCSQLHSMYGGWVERTSFNTMQNVCGESDNGLGGCGKNQCFGGIVQGGQDLGAGVIEPPHTDASTGGWSHAHKICQDAGARLCTVEELKNEVGRGTGCQHDGEMVWTSETCDVNTFGYDEPSAHITVQGGLHRADEACPDECSVGEASGDCMGGEGYCEQELTRGIHAGETDICHYDACVGSDYSPGTCAIATANAGGGHSCDMTGGAAANPPSRYPWAPIGEGSTFNRCVNGKRVCGGYGVDGRGGTASSTVGWGGEPNRAIEQHVETAGATAWGQGSCTHTDAGSQTETNIDGSPHGPAWWQVDLGQGALVNHVDLKHRTDCCQDRLEFASVWVSETADYTTGTKCGTLSDHTMSPEVSQCGQVYGRYVTVAHAHGVDTHGGGTSGGRVVTICDAKVWGVRGRTDTSACTCTPRCAQDSLNMAVRCCADTNPRDAGATCAAKPKYSGKLMPAIVGDGTAWYMWLLYVVIAVAAVVGLLKFWPLIAAKIPKSGPSMSGGGMGGGGGGGMEEGLAAPSSGDSIYG
eukprot:COSAG06_NODE_1498_length_9264_cov_2.916094_5_plen_1484_part_00